MGSGRALVAHKDEAGYRVGFEALEDAPLEAGEVRVGIAYSSLNYKDALAVTGRGKIVRRFPMVCGIDLAGTVLESEDPAFRPGDPVLAVGQGLGELYPGGYAQRACVKAGSLVPIPSRFTAAQAMAIGTAGFTAMLCVLALEHAGLAPGEREVIVTGATGGVGSIAVLLLAGLGYRVAASSGRPALSGYLRELGATTLVPRAELSSPPPPLGSERWAGGVDTVGGHALAQLLSHTQSFGAVAACGMAGGSELKTSVFPFILRNVSLLGINSTQTPRPLALEAWRRLGEALSPERLDAISRIEPLTELQRLSEALLAGELHGRVVIDVSA